MHHEIRELSQNFAPSRAKAGKSWSRVLAATACALWALVAGGSTIAHAADLTLDAGRGPVLVNVPPGYSSNTPAPLVVLLHGYGSSGAAQEAYMQFTPLSDAKGFLFVAPDGLKDSSGAQYWNATNACCDFESNTDDSGYLRSLIELIQKNLRVDAKRIFVTGHSNGGFMSYRMACDHSDLIAAIAPLAGVTWLDPAMCAPKNPVSVLHMHGTQDATIRYDGGCLGEECYPGAVESIDMWGVFNKCQGSLTAAGTFDYESGRRGNETAVRKNVTGCPKGGVLELWRMNGVHHIPSFTDAWNDAVINFFYANPKP